MNTLKQLPELTALVEAGKNPFNQVLMNYVDQGGKTVGFMYQDTPEEIITAAGAAPIYLRGTTSEGTEMAEAFFRQLTCNYTKHTYNEILDGKWDFLDGAVLYNLCDHSRRIYDNWKTIPGNPAYHFMYVPKKRSELSKDFYREEINKLIKATEEHFGVEITKEKLAEAIKLHNETRRLQQEIYEMQKGEEVYLTGLELLMVMLAGVSLPRPEYNKMMKDLIAALKANGPRIKPKVRLLYTGGHADNPEFFELLQQNDAHVVSDNTGFGTRAADVLICEDGDPLEAIINYYFEEKPAATRQMGTQVERRAISEKAVLRAYAVAFIATVCVFVFSFILILLEPGQPIRSIIFEVMSALFTVGSSLGLTPVLSGESKFVLCIAMFLGRVGLLSILIGLLGHRGAKGCSFPNEHIIIN